MKRLHACLFLLVSVPEFAAEGTANWEVHFSPKGGCTEAITNELAKAKCTVLIQA